jgi:O-antigen ligase
MASEALIAAHNNPFNKSVLSTDAFYFSNAGEVKDLVETVQRQDTEKTMVMNNLHKMFKYQFNWERVIDGQNFSDSIGMHATFFSLQLVIALVYLLSELLKKQSATNKVIYSICSVILLAGIIQLSSKSIFVALFLIINLAVPYFLLRDKKRVRFIAVTASISVLVIVMLFTVGNFRIRLVNDLKYDLALTSTDKIFDSRLDRWSTATELISKSPIIGYGAGSELGLLHESFFSKK